MYTRYERVRSARQDLRTRRARVRNTSGSRLWRGCLVDPHVGVRSRHDSGVGLIGECTLAYGWSDARDARFLAARRVHPTGSAVGFFGRLDRLRTGCKATGQHGIEQTGVPQSGLTNRRVTYLDCLGRRNKHTRTKSRKCAMSVILITPKSWTPPHGAGSSLGGGVQYAPLEFRRGL